MIPATPAAEPTVKADPALAAAEEEDAAAVPEAEAEPDAEPVADPDAELPPEADADPDLSSSARHYDEERGTYAAVKQLSEEPAWTVTGSE